MARTIKSGAGVGGTPRPGLEVSDFVHQLLGGPDTKPGIGDRVSDFAHQLLGGPDTTPGIGGEVSDFAHEFLGGPDTAPGGGLALRDFIDDLREARAADVTSINAPESDWLLT
jgi:hypothetical protein